MSFFTIEEGLTIRIPALNTRNWEQVMREECFIRISEHDHSGNGRGRPLSVAAFPDNSISDIKILLRNEGPLQALQADGLTIQEILRVDSNNELLIAPFVKTESRAGNTIVLEDNISTATDTSIYTPDANESYCVHYSLERGTAAEKGIIEVVDLNGTYGLNLEKASNEDSGITFELNADGEITYTSTSASLSATLIYVLERY